MAMASKFGFLLLLASVFSSAWSQFRCPEPNGYFPHGTQCDGYYECVDGESTERLCPEGLMFNDQAAARTLRCDYAFAVDCSNRLQVQPAQPSGDCPHQWGLYANFQDCGRFWNCVEGFGHEFYCPEGLAYNDLAGMCDWPDQVQGCDSEAMLDFSCPKDTDQVFKESPLLRFPYPGDCRRFFACVRTEQSGYEPRLLSCDPPYVFNFANRSCDFVENVKGCEKYYSGPAPVIALRPVARGGSRRQEPRPQPPRLGGGQGGRSRGGQGVQSRGGQRRG